MNQKPLSIVIALVLSAIIVIPAFAGSSMMFRMDPAHSADYSSVSGGILPNNQEKWHFLKQPHDWSSFPTSPAVADDVVYVVDGDVYAINANDGSEKWHFSTSNESDPLLGSSPAVVDYVVYVTSYHNLYAINANNGTQKWAIEKLNVDFFSPVVSDGVIYIAATPRCADCSDVGELYAINASDGSGKWRALTIMKFYDIAVTDGVVYTSEAEFIYGIVTAINASDGSVKWVFFSENVAWDHIAVADGVVYAIGRNSLYAINASDGSEKWHLVFGDWSLRGSPAIANGVIYLGSSDSKVYAVNANDGSQKWVFTAMAGGNEFSEPAVADGVIYVGSDMGSVFAINANDGTQRWTFATGGAIQSSPAVADGVVYVGNTDWKVYAIGTSTYYINILPVTDKCVGEKITITATTNLAVGEHVLVEVYSPPFKPKQKTQSGEFRRVTNIVTVENNGNTINYIRSDFDLSTFVPREYIINVSSLSNSAITNKFYFNIIDCSKYGYFRFPDFSHNIFSWKYCPACPVTASKIWRLVLDKSIAWK
jgi:outer membrane protein assembly factor BamB